MGLKEIWIDKVDGVDDVMAEDINAIAHQAIENAEAIADSEKALGDIETALDRIIAIQNELMGGLITFTVIGNTLNAKQGMTWSEFVESEYNIYGYYIQGNYVVCDIHSGICVTNEDDSWALPSDVIRNGASYGHG